jgi:riboflavin kinase/FMN adenylyltransferase
MSFEPHPRTFFKPEQPVFRLTPAAEKARLLEGMGIDGLISLPFNARFAGSSAEDFVSRILLDRLAVRHVAVGYDFHYGKGRAGTPQTLLAAGQSAGFDVTVLQAYCDENSNAISSSSVRRLLETGEVEAAAERLGYHWFFAGTVVHGEKRGRELGFPTANMQLPPYVRLLQGIYAVMVRRADGAMHPGVASFGRRPQFDNGPPLFETFLPDFEGDLYGEEMHIIPIRYLRAEQAFDSVDALIEQMTRDTQEAQQLLTAFDDWADLDKRLHF